jgi:hypothetical protein
VELLHLPRFHLNLKPPSKNEVEAMEEEEPVLQLVFLLALLRLPLPLPRLVNLLLLLQAMIPVDMDLENDDLWFKLRRELKTFSIKQKKLR